MKKIIVLIFSIFILFLSSCMDNSEIIDITVATGIDSCIQEKEEFRLDKIILNVEYNQNKRKHCVLEESMVKREDIFQLQSVGVHTINGQYQGFTFSIRIMIYDRQDILENYIYYYKMNNQYEIQMGTSIYNLEIPKREGYNFCGWYSDPNAKQEYVDSEKRIIELFPLWTKEKTYKIDFYVVEDFICRKYVVENQKIPFPEIVIPEGYLFCFWDCSSVLAKEDLDIRAVLYKENQAVVRFYDRNKNLLGYRIVPKGSVVYYEPPIVDGYKFIKWSESLDCVTQNVDVYPIYAVNGAKYKVNFFDENGNLLQQNYVEAGEDVEFVSLDNRYEIKGFSASLKTIMCDTNIMVYRTPIVYKYYFTDSLYATALATEEQPEVPYMDSGIGSWEMIEGTTDCFKATYKRKGEVFHLITLDDNKTYDIRFDEITYDFDVFFAALKNDCVQYNWYPEEWYVNSNKGYESKKPSTVASEWETNEVTLYGERKDIQSNSNLLVKIPYKSGYMLKRSNYMGDYVWIVSDEFTAISDSILEEYKVIILGKSISEIVYFSQEKEYKVCYFIVDKNNPKFYSLNGSLYDKETGMLLWERREENA